MLLLKNSGVIHEGLAPEMWYALGVAAALKHKMFGLNCVVTALLDGEHNPGSLHPKGLAGDIRTLDLTTSEGSAYLSVLKENLEPLGFDVVWELGPGATPATTQSHAHIEFQPKPGESFWHLGS